MTPEMTALREAVAEAGSQAALAKQYDLHPSFISLMLSGARHIPEPILDKLGFHRVIVKKEP